MKTRINNLLLGSRRTQFLIIFVVTFLFKLLLAWRSGITRGWQDELSWKTLAQSQGFFATVTEFDAGYPTPLLRAFSFAITQVSASNFLLWHICVLTVISGSLASLAYSKIINTKSRYLLAGLTCSYPSFDLLLLHNLSYWTFIPLFILLANILYEKERLSATSFVFLCILIFFTAKPQLLVAVLIMLVFIVRVDERLQKSVFLAIFLIVVLGLLGRTSQNALDLSLDVPSIVNLIFTANVHFLAVLAPLLVIGDYALSKLLNTSALILSLFFCSNMITILALTRIRRYLGDLIQIRVILISFLVSVGSLYFFPNSGWSQNNLMFSNVYTSLFSRHYLPIEFLAGLTLFLIFQESKRIKIMIFLAVIQNIALLSFLFDKLYEPI